jgi:hypothetical protein
MPVVVVGEAALMANIFIFIFSFGNHNLYKTYGQCEGFHGTALVIEDTETPGALLESRAQVTV